MKEEMRTLEIDKYEYGIIINALNLLRNQQIKESRPTDPVDELLIKVIETPQKKSPFIKMLMKDSVRR